MHRLGFPLAVVLLAGACGQARVDPVSVKPSPASARVAYGVIAGGPLVGNELVAVLRDLGASWVRLNAAVDGRPLQDLSPVLDAGINIVLTLNHRDAPNIDTSYGTTRDWPEAGFPYRSRAVYQQRLRALLTPYARPLAEQRLYVQIENEVSDAADASFGGAKFWRGTTDQYVELLGAGYESVKSVTPDGVVVLSSFAGGALDAAIDGSDRAHEYQVRRITRLLTEGRYDVADLHFYQCADTIAERARFVSERLPAGRRWISTENGGPDFRCARTPLHHDADPTRFEALEAEQVPLRLGGCAAAGGSVCMWFSLMDLSGETEVFRNMGLLDNPYWPKPASGTAVRPPRHKPAYDAFKALAAH